MAELKNQLKELINGNKLKETEKFLLQKKQETILKIIKQYIVNQEGTLILTGILSSLYCSTRESTALKLYLYENLLKFIMKERESRELGEAICVLMLQADNFPPHCLVHLIDLYFVQIESKSAFTGRWTELFGKLISLSANCAKLDINGREVGGPEYLYEVISKLCSLKWTAQTTTTLLTIMKDLDRPKDDLRDVFYKTRKVLDDVDYQSVPPIIYNSILLGQGKCPAKVLEMTIDYFNKQEKKLYKSKSQKSNLSEDLTDISEGSESIEGAGSYEELVEAQSTVILHLIHLAQYDPELVQDFIKIVKNSTWLPQRIFTPINLALSLSLAYIDRYRQPIIDSLKSCILKYFRQEEKMKRCYWMREVFNDETDLPHQIKTAIDNCKGGWDQVSQGLVHLSFSLLESGGGLKGETYPVQQALRLVSTILPAILKKEPQMATSVLQQLSIHILTAISSTQYISLLSKLVKIIPHTMLDNLSIIRELLEQLCFMPLSVSVPLLQALLPLLKMSMVLKDALMIILRKMIFSRQIESRQTAVEGFLQFLRHFKVMGALPSSQGSLSFSSAMSQISADVHSFFDSNTNEALCLELLGALRRCLSQQQEVRSRLYQGLQQVAKVNPKISLNVLDLMHQHLRQYLDLSVKALNPILLKKVIIIIMQDENALLTEPVGELVANLFSCKARLEEQREENGEEDDEEEEVVVLFKELDSLLETLTEKLAHCDMDDLDFGTASFSMATAQGRQNCLFAQQMVAVFDALMEANFYSGAMKDEAKMKTVIALFKTQKKVLDIVKERAKAKKGEGSKAKERPQGVAFASVLSLQMASRVLQFAIEGGEEPCVEIIQNNSDFHSYVVGVVEQRVNNLKTMLPSERDRLLPHLKTAGHLLFKDCYHKMAVNAEEGEEPSSLYERNTKQSLSVLHTLITACKKLFKDKFDVVLKEISGKSNTATKDQVLYSIQKRLQTMLLRILQHEDCSEWVKQAAIVLQLMQLLTVQMEGSGREVEQAHSWVTQVCKDQSPPTSTLSEALVTLMLVTGEQMKPSTGLIVRQLAKEIHCKLGDIDQEVSTALKDDYKVLTEDSAHAVLAAVLTHCDETFLMVEMTLNKQRAILNAGLEFEEATFEKAVSSNLVMIIHSMHEVLQTSLPQGSCLDDVAKTMRKLYTTLNLYVRYYLEYFKIRSGAQMSENFEKLVHFSATMLKENVYIMIKYINSRMNSKRSQIVQTARANKESKLIPALVFSMEEYEKLLIALSKKSGVNLMVNMKASTARDFRIVMKEAPEEQAEDEESRNSDAEEQEEEEEETTMPPPSKRSRRN